MTCTFRAENLAVEAGGRILARGIRFDLSPGTLLAVTGPNGAGKSTFLHVLAGLTPPRAGRFLFQQDDGWQDMNALPLKKHAQLVACVEQAIPDNLPFTVEELTAMGRAPWQDFFGHGSTGDKALCEQAMRECGIAPLAHRPWNQLSGGERQRTMVARALCQTPQLLLLDEPTSALDYRHQQELMHVLKQRCASGLSAIMVTHDLNLAALYADAVLLLGGKSPVQGSPINVFTPDILKEVYGCRLLVDRHPYGCPRISLPGDRP